MDDNIYHLWETGILDRRRSIPNHGRSERDRRSWPANAEKLVSLGHQPGPEAEPTNPVQPVNNIRMPCQTVGFVSKTEIPFGLESLKV